MADVILFTPQRGWTLNGAPLVGGKAIFLQTGTDTEQTVYSDAALTSVLTQPVLADSNGVFPTPYFDGASQVRVIVRDSTDVELSDIDPVPTAPLSSGGASGVTFTPTDALPYSNVQDAIEGVYDTIEDAKTGIDIEFVSGTAGTANNLGKWDANGDLVDAGVAVSTDDTLASNSDESIPTEQAVKGYVDARVTGQVSTVEVTASDDAEIEITWTGAPKKVVIDFDDVQPASAGEDFFAQMSTDGGTTYESGASDYEYYFARLGSGSTAVSNLNSAASTHIVLADTNAAAYTVGVTGALTVHRPGATAQTNVTGTLTAGSTNDFSYVGRGSYTGTSAVTAIRFYFASGNVASGTVRATVEY